MCGGVTQHPKMHRAVQGVCVWVTQHPKMYRVFQEDAWGTEPFRGIMLYPRSCRALLSDGGCVAPQDAQDTARAVRGDLGVAVAVMVQGSTT